MRKFNSNNSNDSSYQFEFDSRNDGAMPNYLASDFFPDCLNSLDEHDLRQRGVNWEQLIRGQRHNICIVGLGYVGAVSCACFSSLGHTVIGVDSDEGKVISINDGASPIVELDLDVLLEKAHAEHRLSATTDLNHAMSGSDITLISVDTPSNHDGGCDLSTLMQVTKQIGEVLAFKTDYHLIVFRSTVPPTTTKKILIPILERYSGKVAGRDFGVCFNPEFLRESCAIDDFYHPGKTVIGSLDARSAKMASEIYQGITCDITYTSTEIAEFVKYIDNTWHALKVSFTNEVGRMCKALSIDSHQVMDIFMTDTKLNISKYYLKPGFSFGGSSLPKDTRGLTRLAKTLGVSVPVIEHINRSNECHIEHTVALIDRLKVTKVAIIGLTFKTGTDDLRESPSIRLMTLLLNQGYEVAFFDPYLNQQQTLVDDPDLNLRLKKLQNHDLEGLVNEHEAIVITHNMDYTQHIAQAHCGEKHIIDVVHLADNLSGRKNYHGICW
ncbi:MAG: nucleotide sugar dehydrogenase [Psychrobium sp.]|nr:nucleotide sugar dehydrogenase [Psychrobium sp.]